MIIGHEESRIPSPCYKIGHTVTRIYSHIIGSVRVMFYLIAVELCVSLGIRRAVVADIGYVVLLKGYEVYMAGLSFRGMIFERIVDVQLITVQRNEIFICQIVVRYEHIVIGVGYDRITLLRVHFLYLFRSLFSVRDSRVAVKVSTVKVHSVTCFGNKYIFHNSISLS